MWVKICGNTNLEDAMLAAELGADAVGFVFAESKRQVTPEQVAAITPHLPAGVERVESSILTTRRKSPRQRRSPDSRPYNSMAGWTRT